MKKFSLIDKITNISGLEMRKIYVRDYNFRIQNTADDSFYTNGLRRIIAYTPASFDSLQLEDFSSMQMAEPEHIPDLIQNVECVEGLRHINETLSFFGKPLSERYGCDSKAYLLKINQKYHAESAGENRIVYDGKEHIAIPHKGNNQLYRLPTGELSIIPEQNKGDVVHFESIPHEHREEIVGENTHHSFHNLHTGNMFTIIVKVNEKRTTHFFSLGGDYYFIDSDHCLHHLFLSGEETYSVDEEILFTFPGSVTVVNGKRFVIIRNRSEWFDCNHTFYILQQAS